VTIQGRDHSTADIGISASSPEVVIYVESSEGKRSFCILDENHAAALALVLQAAVAEIQARAVGR
jgi:hypothetical protein